IFMEMVFRKIEYWIDGDANQQKLLKKMPWNAKKIQKRVLKFVVFFLISFLITNFFLSYIIGMDQLLSYIQHPITNIPTLISLLIFTSVFFFVYWWFREQVCIVVCPYGRLQGVLLDQNSIVVAYDYKRGEPRGKLEKKPEAKVNGDCIDCLACVRVCPTGIDIRNGTQLECVNCTACIDACDAIMDSIEKPKGLIRYASENSIKEGIKLSFTPRIKSYTAILSLLISLLVFLIVSRTDLDARLMRTAGMTYTSLPDGRISNLYNLKLANKTHDDISFSLKLENLPGEIQLIDNDHPVVKKEDYLTLQFFVKMNRADVKNWETPVVIGLYDSTKKIKTIRAKFIGPEVYQ
ncbi:MAG TPA: cytochrome c oxidase accessory protein CcoG, partial [Hanamia sp.]|nr:cytochrome c oxidase accessory protein CcoG [Hanamia sp.]